MFNMKASVVGNEYGVIEEEQSESSSGEEQELDEVRGVSVRGLANLRTKCLVYEDACS